MLRLSDFVRQQARWRESVAERFPDDERNQKSAEALHALAEYVENRADPDVVFELNGVHHSPEAAKRLGQYGLTRPVGEHSHAWALDDLLQHARIDAEARAAGYV